MQSLYRFNLLYNRLEPSMDKDVLNCSSIAGYVLTASDLPQLQKLLVDEAYQSFTMGIHLGLSVGVIRALKKDAPSDIFQFQGLILAKWLQCTSPRPTETS